MQCGKRATRLSYASAYPLYSHLYRTPNTTPVEYLFLFYFLPSLIYPPSLPPSLSPFSRLSRLSYSSHLSHFSRPSHASHLPHLSLTSLTSFYFLLLFIFYIYLYLFIFIIIILIYKCSLFIAHSIKYSINGYLTRIRFKFLRSLQGWEAKVSITKKKTSRRGEERRGEERRGEERRGEERRGEENSINKVA